MERKRSVGWMCIVIEKIAESDTDAEYAFIADVTEPNPRFRTGSIVVGHTRGVLNIAKATGEVTLVEAMPEDAGDVRFRKAAGKIQRHWEAGEFPDKTMYACG